MTTSRSSDYMRDMKINEQLSALLTLIMSESWHKGEKVSQKTLQKIADYVECDAVSLCRSISGNVILQTLRDEKEAKISGGLYHELQVRMTYNSNHIEGSKLTEDQTRQIFETNIRLLDMLVIPHQ